MAQTCYTCYELTIQLAVLMAMLNILSAYPCPAPLSIQMPGLASSFNLSQFTSHGLPYYELALHDYTQPSVCGCMRSEKRVMSGPGPAGTTPSGWIADNFTMACPYNTTIHPKIYISPLAFNITTSPGVFRGHWSVTKSLAIPDTVVAVGQPDNPGGPYRWALEFQCVEAAGHAIFVGINFYSRARLGGEAARSLREMLAAAHQQGLEQYWNRTKAGLRIVSHENCVY